MVLLLPPHRRS